MGSRSWWWGKRREVQAERVPTSLAKGIVFLDFISLNCELFKFTLSQFLKWNALYYLR